LNVREKVIERIKKIIWQKDQSLSPERAIDL
jgi:hypothetical protein